MTVWRQTESRNRIIIGWVLFAVTLLAVAAGVNDVGLTWDETLAHIYGSEVFRIWLDQVFGKLAAGQWAAVFDPVFLEKFWPRFDPEDTGLLSFNYHPPLTRYLPTLTWKLFHGAFGEVTAYRLAPAILFALLVMVLFRAMAKEFDFSTGLFAALSLLILPRVFGHAHIAATDITLTALWWFTLIAFYKGLEDKKWSWAFAVLLGFTCLSKFTGFLIPPALVLYMVLAKDRRVWRNFLYALWVVPLVLYLLNPTLCSIRWKHFTSTS